MGEAELKDSQLIIHSHIITYGNAANDIVTENIRSEIESMWNAPNGTLMLKGNLLLIRFQITALFRADLADLEIISNTDPRNNYFRIEEFAQGNISFVDGLKSNTGYFKLENLYSGSTTAAHEYGHTLGLDHPEFLDIRGQGKPGIMYPRGTLVDPEFQYDPSQPAGVPGGTMHPMYRTVKQTDLDDLRLSKLGFTNGRAIIGDFTNVWHPDHGSLRHP